MRQPGGIRGHLGKTGRRQAAEGTRCPVRHPGRHVAAELQLGEAAEEGAVVGEEPLGWDEALHDGRGVGGRNRRHASVQQLAQQLGPRAHLLAKAAVVVPRRPDVEAAEPPVATDDRRREGLGDAADGVV